MNILFLTFVLLGIVGLSFLSAALWTYSDMRKGKPSDPDPLRKEDTSIS